MAAALSSQSSKYKLKMKRIINILFVILILIVTGCQDNSSLDLASGQSENYPIRFGITADLNVEAKAAINNDNVKDYGFLAFGNLTVDGEQQSLLGETGTPVIYDEGAWTYSPLRFWQTGSYEFAAVMPYFYGYTPSFSADNQLTLDFGTAGFNLASSQKDLMVAFHSKPNQIPSSATPVDFDFDHQLSLITIEGASKNQNTTGINVTDIKVYGNSARTVGNMVFTNNKGTVTSQYTLMGTTTLDSPYMTFRAMDEAGTETEYDWKLTQPSADGTPVYDVLIPELIVFPETCEFTIVVNYTEDGNRKTMTGSLPATWEAGKKYTYRFHLASDISFSVDVAKWGSNKVGDEIPII